jgi:hypothetical protein
MVRYIFNHVMVSINGLHIIVSCISQMFLKKDTTLLVIVFFIVGIYLELFHIRANIKFLSEVGPWLSVQIPIRIRNLWKTQSAQIP